MKITFVGAIILIGGVLLLLALVANMVQRNEKQTSQANEQSKQPNLPAQ
jgi:TRAP-type C4-dicarboxylate transport system permease small subunit